MRFHREGYLIIIISLIVLASLLILTYFYLASLLPLIGLIILGLLLFILQFFRHPKRKITQKNDQLIFSPADGKIVVVEEKFEDEILKEKRLMISIFMSPTNVHCNRVPISGRVKYTKYHPGKYLVAWHPKSSSENERNTIVLESNNQQEVLVRQIAGAMARRIKSYLKSGELVVQGQELGFIKFGSRVDLFLPLDANIKVKLGQKVKANIDVIAEWG